MTDLYKFQQLLESVGLGHKVTAPSNPETLAPDYTLGRWIVFTAGEHRLVEGYFGFEARFEFSVDGKFLGMKIYE